MSKDLQRTPGNLDFSTETAFFAGTIVPVKKLFEYLAAGKSIEEFFTDVPFISREHVQDALDQIA